MVRILVTAAVKDGKKWEEGFRTHRDLFKSMSVTSLRYGVTGNDIAVYSEAKDKDKYFKVFDSKATADAMTFDGVKRDTVKVYVLDKTLEI